MFDDQTRKIIRLAARDLGVPAASLMAVVKVESGGRIFAMVDGRKEPLIRFEGHYFYRLLPRAKRNKAVIAGLAHARAGRVRNPRRQIGRWAMLGKASKLDRNAALSSVSWGVGQVMGIHWRWLGYASIDSMVVAVRAGIEGQVDLMVRFIRKSGLCDALQRGDWAGFARHYNGPNFHRHRYDKLMADSYRLFVSEGEEGCRGEKNAHRAKRHYGQRHGMVLLRVGLRAGAVLDLQNQLAALGFHLARDGDFGPATERAVKRFQRQNRLIADGIVGPKTFEMLMRKMPVGGI